jgi:competence protein ComEC
MLPSLTGAFIVGLGLGSFLPYFPIGISSLLLMTILGSVAIERHCDLQPRRVTGWVGFLLAGTLAWSVMEARSTVHGQFDDRRVKTAREITARIVSPVQQGPDRLTLIVAPDTTSTEEALPERIRLTWRSPDRLVFHRDRIRFHAKLRDPNGSMNPGGFDYAAYAERQGIGAVATVSGAESVVLVESGLDDRWWWLSLVDRWRGKIRLAAVQSLSQPSLGIYLGTVLGDRSYLEQDLRDQFMVTGTVHLLSISGSHLGLVAVLFFFVTRGVLLRLPSNWLLNASRFQTPSRFAACLTVIPVTAYAFIAGAELATIRSLLMVHLALMARWLGYEHRVAHAVALAAMVILLHDPQAIYDISFQLSFVSVFAIATWFAFLDDKPGEQHEGDGCIVTGLRWGKEAMILSGVVTLVTLPLIAFYFNQIQWLGLFTNLLAVPVMGFLLVPMGLMAGIWPVLSGELTIPMAEFLQMVIHAFSFGLGWTALIPGGEWHVASPSIPVMAVFYLLLGLLRWSGRWKRLRYTAGIAVGLIIVWWCWSPRLGVDGERFRITFLDVGQGDSTVVELPDGQVILIDGGATFERFDMGRGVVGPYLWNRGIRSLDHVIATHPQLDHVGGLTWVVKHFDIRQFWGIGERREEVFYRRLAQALAQRGLMERNAKQGDEILASGPCRLLVLSPPAIDRLAAPTEAPRNDGHGLNNRSVVARLVCGRFSVMFPADVEHETLARLLGKTAGAPADVLKVPHHGALSSLDLNWIAALDPKAAVVSVGRYNSYGHPAPEVVHAYETRGVRLYRTDRDGGIWLTGSLNGPFAMRGTRELQVRRTIPPACLWTCEKASWVKLWEQWLTRTW